LDVLKLGHMEFLMKDFKYEFDERKKIFEEFR